MNMSARFWQKLLSAILPLLIGVAFPGTLHPQDLQWLDGTLTRLRGTWDYHTYDEKWTLEFDCDHKMVIDRQPADYSLTPDTLRIQGNDGSAAYPYRLAGDKLTLVLPDGSERTYHKSGSGSAEESLNGNYFAAGDSASSIESMSFDGDQTVVLYGMVSGQPASMKGIYRVEVDMAVLTFGDTASYEAPIQSRKDNGTVRGLTFDNQLFQLDEPAPQVQPAASTPSPIIETYHPRPRTYDPPPTGIGFVPDYSAPPPTYQTQGSTPGSTAKSGTRSDSKPRDFGTTRKKPDSK